MDTVTERHASVNELQVWDPLVRVFHWSLAIAFAVAYLTEDELQDLHVWAGYTVFGLLVFRLAWGLLGSHHARFSSFVTSPRQSLRYLFQALTLKAPRHLGHNPAGAAMIVLLLASLLVTTISGMALYGADTWLGPLAGLLRNVDEAWIEVFEETHEIFANLTLALVVVHVLGVVWESLLHRENLVRAMFTGRKRA